MPWKVPAPRHARDALPAAQVFGQYAVGAIVTGIIQFGDPTLPAPFATIMPYGYAGGPVVAEAMKDLYAEDSFNYPDGYTLAMMAATVGMFAGVIAGAVLVNFAPLSTDAGRSSQGAESASVGSGSPPRRAMRRARQMIAKLKASAGDSDHYAPDERPAAMEATVSVESLDSLMFHLCMVGCVMMVGYVLRLPVVAVEEFFPEGSFLQKSNLLSVLPLFLFCLLGGLVIQRLIDRFGTDSSTGKSFIDRGTIMAISNTAQDILIVAAISRLGRNGLPPGVHGLGHFFQVIWERGFPFLCVCFAGLAWGILSFWYVAPRLLPDYWAERALVEFGVSIGATSTGLLLLRMADPEGKTPVLTGTPRIGTQLEPQTACSRVKTCLHSLRLGVPPCGADFTFKQIFHVLITGGGFFDVLVPIPLTSTTESVWPLLLVVILVMLLLLLAHPATCRRCRRGAARDAGQAIVRRGGPSQTAPSELPSNGATSSTHMNGGASHGDVSFQCEIQPVEKPL